MNEEETKARNVLNDIIIINYKNYKDKTIDMIMTVWENRGDYESLCKYIDKIIINTILEKEK